VAECAPVREALEARERGAELPAQAREHLATCAMCAAASARFDALDEALGGLADDALAPPPFESVAGAARAAARGRRQARIARRALPVTLAFASAVVATVGATRALHHPEGRVAAAGDVLDASRGLSEAALADGSRVTVVSGRAIVESSNPAGAVVRVETGTAYLNVPHLTSGRSFVVRTDEVEARVHGTRFEVGRGSQGTRVSVAEGTVEIRPRDPLGEAFLLTRGESRLVEGLPQRRARARAVALASLDQRDDSTAGTKIEAWLATEPPAEEAAEAHALLAWKLSRDGDRAGAMEHYRRALALLPSDRAPLWADNASAQLARLEEANGAAAGAAAWRRYLERFPGGVHAATARGRLAGPPDRSNLGTGER
jgi:ferric-dicitrate binding protein FerR (iron transport regulator)